MKKTITYTFFFPILQYLANAKGTLQSKSNITDAFVYVDVKRKAMLEGRVY